MIKNKKLLIDVDCPMCKIYGNIFTSLGMIDKQTVSPYQFSSPSYTANINMERAKSEIALYDTNTTKTVYGLDAFLEILCQENRVLKAIANISPVKFLAKQLYLFTSFNRKVMAGPGAFCTGKTCTPPFHLGYRLGYILLSALFTGFVLTNYFQPVFEAFQINYYPGTEYFICFGQILWQVMALRRLPKSEIWEYLGNMSSVSNLGAILLIPAYLIAALLGLSAIYMLIAFAIVVGIILLEHISRSRKLGLGETPTLSWVAYRIVILALLSSLNIVL